MNLALGQKLERADVAGIGEEWAWDYAEIMASGAIRLNWPSG